MFEWQAARTFLVSLLPGVFWFAYLRSLSGGKVSAWWTWAVAFAAGWASIQVTLFISKGLGVDALYAIPHVGSLIFFLFGVGLVEEGAKALCALVALKAPGLADKPLTALQLCGGVALGFATTENLVYANQYGEGVLVGRFVFTTLGHILFSSVWGFALGTRSTSEKASGTPWGAFFGFLLLASLSHGLYDWFLVSQRPVMAMLVLIALWYGFREASLGAYLREVYQRNLPFELARCPHCSVLTRAKGNYCSFCGESISSEPELLEPEVSPTAP